MNRAVALLRCSTSDQDTRHQRDAITAWANAQGVPVPEFREEAEVSGASKSRPVLDEIVRDATRGRIKLLVVYEMERLGRTMQRIVMTVSELSDAGCAIMDVRRGLDTRTGMGKAMIYIAGVFAEIERESLRERTRSGLAAARARGVRLGKRPDRWDEEALETLRERVAAGWSVYKLHKANDLVVWRPCLDKLSGTWTEKPAHPGETALYRRVAELRAEDAS